MHYAPSRHNHGDRPDERAHRRSATHPCFPTDFAAHGRRQAKLRTASGRRPAPRQPISRITPPRYNMLAGRSVVAGGEIPYQPWAAAKKAENFQNRQKADPLAQCYMPGVPRIMYLDFPFQIFQTPQAVAIDLRMVAGLSPDLHRRQLRTPTDFDSWMGDSRGHWEGDTLVVDVSNIQRQNLVRHGGGLSQRRAPRGGAIPHDRPRHDSVRSDHRGFESLHQAVDHQHRLCTGEPIGTGFSSTSARLKPKRRTARSRARSERGIRAAATTPPVAIEPAARRMRPRLRRHAVANIRRTPDGKPDLQGFYEPDARRREPGPGKTRRRRGSRRPDEA